MEQLEEITFKQEEKNAKLSPLQIVFIVLASLVALISVCYFTFSSIYEYHYVDGQSMNPTLNASGENTDIVYVASLSSSTYGDIVVARNLSGTLVVKRLIAFGGDKIKCVSETSDEQTTYHLLVWKKGQDLPTEFNYAQYNITLSNEVFSSNFFTGTISGYSADENGYFLLKEDDVFLLGDNMKIGGSTDCADNGPYRASKIVGKVRFIVNKNEPIIWQIITQVF